MASSVSAGGPEALALVRGKELAGDSLETPLLSFSGEGEGEYAVYPRRYWLLFLLSVASMQQSCVWMTWSPAVTQVQALYGWSTATVDLLAAWGPIIYCPVCLFTANVVERLGLRASITTAATLTLVGEAALGHADGLWAR